MPIKDRLAAALRSLAARIEPGPAVGGGASGASYGDFFEEAPLALAALSMKGGLHSFNRRFIKEFGYSREDLPTIERWWELAYPDPGYRASVRSSWNEAVAKARAEGSDVAAREYLVRRKDGSSGSYLITARQVGDALLAGFVDISERKRAEAARRKAEDMSRLLVDASPAFYVAVGADGKVRAMNRALLEALETSEEEALGLDYLASFVPPDERFEASEVLRRMFQGAETMGYASSLASRSGREILVEWHGRPALGEDGSVDFAVMVGIDVSERVRAAESLAESLERYSALTEYSDSGIWQIDLGGRTVYANPTMYRIIGATPESLEKRHYLTVFAPECRARVEGEHEKRAIGIASTYEAVMQRDDGGTADVLVSAAPYRDAIGRVTGTIASIIDISDRKRAEALLRSAEEEGRRHERLLREQNEGMLGLLLDGSLYRGDLAAALRSITELACRLAVVDRATIWFNGEDGTSASCVESYDAASGEHGAASAIGQLRLDAVTLGYYRDGIVAFRDLEGDPGSRPFATDYLKRRGTRAGLAAPIRFGPRMQGIIGLESMSARDWRPDDERLVAMLATAVSLAYQAAEHHRDEEELKRLNAELERKVGERTEDLASANLELQAANAGLARALEELKAAQGKVLVAEKLAALGRLMAGIAHELNTPLAAIAASARLELRSLGAGLEEMALAMSRLGPEEFAFIREARSRLVGAEGGAIDAEPAAERSARRTAQAILGAAGVPEAEAAAEDLVELGIPDLADKAARLLAKPEGADLLVMLRGALGAYRAARIAESAAAKASRVVSALRIYARGGEDEVPARMGLAVELRGILALFHDRARRGMEIVLSVDEGIEIFGRRESLSRVWLNILDNAFEAMGEVGRIEIRGRAEGGSAFVDIADSGPGIPEPIRERIFEPFFTTKGSASGLGLDVARRLARENGGDISFASEPGRTVFTVRLPLAAE